MIPPDECPRCQHSHGGHYSCYTPAVLSRYGGHATTRCWPRGHAGGGTPAPPQSSRPTCFAVNSGAVAPRHQQARHSRHQHATSRKGQVNHLGRVPVPSVAHSHSPVAHSHPPSALHVSSAVCIASLATVDLWAELECRRSGEDDRVNIECQLERHRCQGHNLDGDYDAVDTAPVGQDAHTPTPPAGSGGGCMALAPHLCMVVWPQKF
jgi:hypothetical protein